MRNQDNQSPEPAEIRTLGDPLLRQVAERVTNFRENAFAMDRQRLYATLVDFRTKNNFGRAISAPQIGIGLRLIAMRLDGDCRFIVNPEIAWESTERFTMWDDCMSFPSLLVRLERAQSISIHFQNESGQHKDWERLDVATSELLQHEIDHLNGVLAVDHAIDRDAIIMRKTYEAMPEQFSEMADYKVGASARYVHVGNATPY